MSSAAGSRNSRNYQQRLLTSYALVFSNGLTISIQGQIDHSVIGAARVSKKTTRAMPYIGEILLCA